MAILKVIMEIFKRNFYIIFKSFTNQPTLLFKLFNRHIYKKAVFFHYFHIITFNLSY